MLVYFARLHLLPSDAADARADELIASLGIADFARLRCGALSTGQKQRVNIARALVADPPVLIMDEPTLGLDVLSNRVILDVIRGQRDAGKTIILSTHYLDEAETMCDQIGLLHDGRLVAEGSLGMRAETGEQAPDEHFPEDDRSPRAGGGAKPMIFPHRIRTIYWKELIDILRDRRTLVAMVVVPIVLYPLLMLGSVQAVSHQTKSLEHEDLVLGVVDDGQRGSCRR